MDGECRRVNVGQSPDIVPSLLSILDLQATSNTLFRDLQALYFDVARKVFKDKTIHVGL